MMMAYGRGAPRCCDAVVMALCGATEMNLQPGFLLVLSGALQVTVVFVAEGILSAHYIWVPIFYRYRRCVDTDQVRQQSL